MNTPINLDYLKQELLLALDIERAKADALSTRASFTFVRCGAMLTHKYAGKAIAFNEAQAIVQSIFKSFGL